MPKPKLHLEILDRRLLAMLPKLKFLSRDHGFYLAGGTALALQIGHRTSIDFDCYSPKEFDNAKVIKSLEDHFPRWTLIQNEPNTLMVRMDGVEVSVFYYQYLLLKPVIPTDFLDLAAKEDIAAMKMIAIVQRGTRRDFVDMYFLLKEFTMERIFQWTEKKFHAFHPYVGMRALCYFEDAEKDEQVHRFTLLHRVDWKEVKRKIIEEVVRFKKDKVG